MCRHVAYLGPPIPLSTVLYDAPHSLVRQSFAPKDMRRGGVVNADGFGVGWYLPDRPEPVRYRRGSPLWTDATLPALASATVSGAFLAAVRNATAGLPVMETAAAPFAGGPWLFSHNGAVTGWPASLAEVASTVDITDLLTLDAPTDAALIWALLRRRLRAGKAPADALLDTLHEVARAAPGSRLNFLLTDGVTAVATTWGHALSVHKGLIASEPLDGDPGWQPVPDGHLVVLTATGCDITPIQERA